MTYFTLILEEEKVLELQHSILIQVLMLCLSVLKKNKLICPYVSFAVCKGSLHTTTFVRTR